MGMRAFLGSGAALLALGLAAPAHAFCGFFVSGADAKLTNDATTVVLLRDGTRTVLSMQNAYAGPPEDFALVVPVPVVLQKENVKTLSKDVFEHVDALTAPRLVEYWEQDPCPPEVEDDGYNKEGGTGTRAKGEEGSMGNPNAYASRVTVEATFAVGEYEIVILGAKDSAGLDGWLRAEHYKIPNGAEPALRPYVAAGSKFFVAKVNTKKVRFEDGRLKLSPLRFHYDAETFALPVRLGLLSSGGTQDLVAIIVAKDRYEVANYPNAFVPTNIDVEDAVRVEFPRFYAALFDATLAKHPNAVVTEYAWQATSCDPCPVSALAESDFSVLGGDTLSGFSGNNMAITRLHARYTKESLGEDLVFRVAPPITGGRESDRSEGPRAAYGYTHTSEQVNNFQARYAIRHRWQGPIRCKNPDRDEWGAPPNGVAPSPAAVKDVASAPRGPISLPSLVRSDVAELGIVAERPLALPSRWRAVWAFGVGIALGIVAAIALLRRTREGKRHAP
jgi:hypothetical protein